MTKLIVYAAARADFEAAIAWYRERSPTAAARFEAAVSLEMETIRSNPELYSKWDDQHRFALVRRFPYYIAYRAFPDRIEVVAIHHTSRDPAGWQDR